MWIKRVEEKNDWVDEPEFPEIVELPAEAFSVPEPKSAENILDDAKNKTYTNTKPVYREGNFLVIRNSKFGACPREIWAYGSGIEPSREQGGGEEGSVFEEGHLHEAAVKNYCREKLGWVIENEEEEFNFRMGSVIIRGHADIGRLFLPGDTREYCCEIKSFGAVSWEKFMTFGFDAYPGYLMQIAVMSHALGRPAVFIGKNRDNGKKTDPIIWDDPPISRGDIVRRAITIKNAIESGEMPDCGTARKHFSGWCLFGQLHKDEPIPQGAVIRPDLEWVLEKYKTLKKVKANEEERAEMLRMIERELPEDGIPLICGGLKAIRASSMKLDRKKLANDYPEVYKKCLVESESKVKIMGVKESGIGIEDDDE